MNTFGGGFNQNKPAGFNQPAAAGGFGQMNAPQQGGFGQQPAGGFGQQTGGFNQPQQQQQGGMFGQQLQQQPAAGTGFGQQPATGVSGFGQPAANTGFGQQPAAPSAGFGKLAVGAGGFGQQPQQQANAFGQPQQQANAFGQQAAGGGFGIAGRGAAAGFGAPATGGFGAPATGGFGQQAAGGGFGIAGRGATAGFGAPATGGFGAPATGGFGQQAAGGGFGIAGRGATAGFGAPATGGFGQQLPQQQASGFQQTATGGFGAAGRGAAAGFGAPAAGGFGQPAQQPQQAGSGFGQTPAGGGFGQTPAGSGFGQTPAGGGFGQTPAGGGFGQTATGGGFGQPAAGGGFGQTPAVGGFGSAPQQPATGGFGVAGRGATTGFGAPAAGGFGQSAGFTGFGASAQQTATGGFGAAGRGATTGFGAPAAGGFGQPAQQPQQAGSGFGQTPAGGGFGQTATGGGFGQPAAGGGFGQTPAVGGFGSAPQQPATGGFGVAGRGATTGFGAPAGGALGTQQPTAGTGFGQTASGFRAPAPQPSGAFSGFGQQPVAGAGGFGQPAAAGTGFGQPAAGRFGPQASPGGFGALAQQPTTAGALGQAPAAAGATAAAPPAGFAGLNFGRPNDLAFMSLPDYNASPYGNVLLFDTYERPLPPKQAPASSSDELSGLALSTRRAFHTWLVGQMRVPEENTLLNQGPASLGASALSPFALKEMLVPAVQLGSSSDATQAATPGGPQQQQQQQSQFAGLPPSRPLSAAAEAADSNAAAPQCSNPGFVLSPSLEELATYTPEKLRRVSHFSVRLRDGSCEVRFLDPVNLVRADVGAVLRLSHDGRAVLYPTRATAPPPNSGLNVCAEVRVRDEAGELREELMRHCREVQGNFVGYRQGWCVYRLNDTGRSGAEGARAAAANATAATSETSGLHPLTIVHDDDDAYSHNLDDTRDDDEMSDRDVDVADGSASSLEDAAHRTEATPAAAAAPTAVVRRFTASRPTPAAERRPTAVSSVGGGEFELPYELPDMSARSKVEPFAVKLGAARPSAEPRVLYVRAKESVIQRTYVNHPGALRGSEKTVRGMLARSTRASWSGAGTFAFAAHAELRDGADADGAVPEVLGDRAVAETPFHWHKPANRALTQCAVSLLRLFLQHTDVAVGEAGVACPQACIHLHRDRSHNTLSAEKLLVVQKAVEDMAASHRATLTRIEALSTRQTIAVVSLLSALYALPEADDALPNAVEEARYLRQLRHRNLAGWLKQELATFLDETKTAALSPAEELVQIMLCHKLREARASARSIANEELARVVRVCGEGNQFGGYVEMAKGGFRDGEEVRQRVVGLLSGKVEPFLTDDEYTGVRDSAAEVRPVPSAATWKQLLGIFTFYGCAPDTSAEDIVLTFLDRLRAPSSRKLNPLPPYAERVDAQTLRTKRGKDLVQRGNAFQDAALLLLEGFANGSAPPARCLHPHASSYAGTDYLTAFVIVVAVRAIELPREQTYRDAEVSVLLGITAALECNDETWFWGLLPLHLIESAADRQDAVRSFCKRNAMRAAALKSQGGRNVDYDRLLSLLRVNAAWLEPVVAPAEETRKAPENSPSVSTHAALERALAKLAM